MVFQSYELFPHLDVLQNLILGPIKAQGRDKKEVTEEALQLLERVGLLDKQHSFAPSIIWWTEATCCNCPCPPNASRNHPF